MDCAEVALVRKHILYMGRLRVLQLLSGIACGGDAGNGNSLLTQRPFAQFRTKDGGVCKRPSYYGWDKKYKCVLEDKLDVMLKQMQSV